MNEQKYNLYNLDTCELIHSATLSKSNVNVLNYAYALNNVNKKYIPTEYDVEDVYFNYAEPI